MKNCKLCKSLHEESGDICRVCIVGRVTWKDEETFKQVLNGRKVVLSPAYKNMAKGKRVHSCYTCGRLTPDEDETFCKFCKEKEMSAWQCSGCGKGIGKANGLCNSCTSIQNTRIVNLDIPKKVDWERLTWFAAITTAITIGISFAMALIPFSWLFQLFLALLFSSEVSYYFRVPLFVPFMFLSIGLTLHLFFKFYYGGFFSPIRRWFNNLKIGLENLKLSAKIRWNAYWSRRKTIQAYKNQKVQEYQLLKDRIKLEDDSYEITKQYLRQNRTEPNLEQAHHQQ